MSTQITSKIISLSIVYIVISIAILILLDAGWYWLYNNVVSGIFNWFNDLGLITKIFLIAIGFAALFWSILEMVGTITTLLGGLIFDKLPQNGVTIIGSIILSVCNAIYNIYLLWTSVDHFSIWVVLELLILTVFVFGLSAIVMPTKDQLKEYR